MRPPRAQPIAALADWPWRADTALGIASESQRETRTTVRGPVWLW